MARRNYIVQVLAMALVAAALLGMATPVCAMPDCGDITAGTCSDFIPVCDDCPDEVVMKHTHDDAVSVFALEIPAPVALADTPTLPAPAVVTFAVCVPEATASPPPADPLGVRLTV